ncbi:MAG: GTPase HflX, partial [Elusimicrobia bacterium]|nr:GTPase HflX [Elusimicrobiota bacterium]
GGSVVGQTLQSLNSIHPSTLIGMGKVKEIQSRASQKEFNTVILDEELKPAQIKNLSDLIPAKILDRTRLILDIFAKRARTREGIMQVELAQLSYLLPRITERYGRFEQQVGGIGTRGPGERKLEVEQRHIRDKMAALRKDLETIKLHREVARERRKNVPLPTVAIIGYTNAGKSTLLNQLVALNGELKDPIYADNKLFATLDPTTRRIRLPSGRWALFTDTVGFVKKLPHHLIAAFRSTLEETLDADLLIHLVDASDRNQKEHCRIVLEILRALRPDDSNLEGKTITVHNKIDLVAGNVLSSSRRKMRSPDFEGEIEESVPISATQGNGLNQLLRLVEEKLSERMLETELTIPFKKMSILPSLYRLGQVETVAHRRNGVRLHLKLEKAHYEKLQRLIHEGTLK